MHRVDESCCRTCGKILAGKGFHMVIREGDGHKYFCRCLSTANRPSWFQEALERYEHPVKRWFVFE